MSDLTRVTTNLIKHNGLPFYPLISPLLDKVKPVINIPADFPNLGALAAYLKTVNYDGTRVIVNVAAGTYRETEPVDSIFGTRFGEGRIQIQGAGVDVTTFEFQNVDGIYARHGECYGHGPQYPVAGGDLVPFFTGVTLSGISRDGGLDDPYLDKMGVRAFDGGMVVLGDSVLVTKFTRVGIMAERNGLCFVPGTQVKETGSDCFAASEGGYIYCPNTVGDNPKGHCYIGYSGGHLYMPNCVAKNAVLHGSVGGSGLVVTGDAYAYAKNLTSTNNAQRGVSVAVGSKAVLDNLVESGNALPVTISHDSTAIMPNATLSKPSDGLALLVNTGGTVIVNVATTDKLTVNGRITLNGGELFAHGVAAASGITITCNSGNAIAITGGKLEANYVTLKGAPNVGIYAFEGSIVTCTNGQSDGTSGSTIISQGATVNADNFQVGGTPNIGIRSSQGGRMSARGAKVNAAGQYAFDAQGVGSVIDATNSTVPGNAFNAYHASNGGQIMAPGTAPSGTYDSPYVPPVNTLQSTSGSIIIK